MSCNPLVKVEIDVVGGEAIARHLARLLYWQITWNTYLGTFVNELQRITANVLF